MDQDGDGKIDFDEFVTATFDRKKLLSKDNIKKAFDMFDRDGSGTITKKELHDLFNCCQGVDAEFENMWTQVMTQVHLGDGEEITFDEFSLCMEKILEVPKIRK